MIDAESAWWDSLEEDALYDNAYGVPHYDVDAVAGFVVDQLGIDRHDTVLDIGCGPGRLARAVIGRTGCQLVGFDVAPNMVLVAQDGGRGVFVTGDGLTLPVDGPFDAAYAVTVFQHVRHAVVRGYMRQTLERLTPHGRLLFSFAEGDEDTFLSHQATAAAMMGWLADAGYCNIEQLETPATHPAWHWMKAEAP